MLLLRDLYPIGLLHSTVNAIFPRVYRTGLPTVRAGDGTSMFLVLWEFEVKPGNERRFEQVHAPGGDWDTIFRSDANHAGPRRFRDPPRIAVYLPAHGVIPRICHK